MGNKKLNNFHPIFYFLKWNILRLQNLARFKFRRCVIWYPVKQIYENIGSAFVKAFKVNRLHVFINVLSGRMVYTMPLQNSLAQIFTRVNGAPSSILDLLRTEVLLKSFKRLAAFYFLFLFYPSIVRIFPKVSWISSWNSILWIWDKHNQALRF